MDGNIIYSSTFDIPVKYKSPNSKEKLEIYPITLKDYLFFTFYSQCLTFDKNSIPDANIIRMTNLEYIYYITQEDEKQPFLLYFDRILGMCLKNDESFKNPAESIQRYGYNEKGKAVFKIGETHYNSKDFDKLREIICFQNLVDLPDENMSKEVRDSLEEAEAYKRKLSGSKPGTLEDYIVSLSIATGWKMEYIYEMNVRKFITAIRRMDNLIHYKIYLAASMSGMVEFKDKSFIKHWLTSLEEEKYKDVSVDFEEVIQKVSM